MRSVLTAAVAASLAAGVSSAQDKHAQGKLSWALHKVAFEAERDGAVRAQGRRYVDAREQSVTAVAILREGVRSNELAPFVVAAGGRVIQTVDRWGWVKLSAPPRALRSISDHASVRRMRTPYYPTPHVVSEGAATVHAPEFQARTGLDGSGVTVAILDTAWKGAADLIGSELPADTEISEFVRDRLSSYDDPHGTACAEVVHDVAPGAALLLLGFEDGVSYADALNEVIDRRIPIVSHSLGFTNIYPADGLSPFSEIANIMASNGVLFVTAAGNETGNFYRGRHSDIDANGMIDFESPGGRVNALPIGALASGSTVVLRWDDPYEGSTNDYDLFVVNEEFLENPVFENNPEIIASSQDLQNGTQDPLEVINLEIEEDGVYFAIIWSDSATNLDQEFSLWASAGIHPDFMAIKTTLSLPADASGAFAVGAVNLDLGLEGFSSRGPTDDGRIKPDLTAPDQISGESYGEFGFWGTSASTPHVAGGAALILSGQLGMSVQQLRSTLERATASGGDATRKNNDIGFGLLDLNKAQ